jgi:undecaprenyl-diphosphatase
VILPQAVPVGGLSIGQSIILGIVEGITEFLPISSTAHLVLASYAMRLTETEFLKSFQIIIQFGAILSVVVLYWRRFLNWEVFKKLVVAFIPTGIIGLTVYKVLKSYLLGNLRVTLASLLVGGIVLIVFERFSRGTDSDVDFAEITYRKALLIGLWQSVSIIPGVSRAAATIIGGMTLGVSKRTIVEFSFMLAVPTMLAASGLEIFKNHLAISENVPALGVGFVVSFVMAILAIKSFLAYVKKRDFRAFGWYRVVLAVVYFFVFVR